MKGKGKRKEEGEWERGGKRQNTEMGREGKEAGNEQGEVREMKEEREERGQ